MSFNETQRFDQWWLKAVLAIPLFETVAFMLNDYQSTGDLHTRSVTSFAVIVFVVLLIWLMSLTTKIDETGISYRFFPFHPKAKLIKWEEIASAKLRDYSPLKEYGGWGIRYSLNGKAYNVKGKTGLQLELKNGKKILIGTSDRQKLVLSLEDLKKQYAIAAIQ